MHQGSSDALIIAASAGNEIGNHSHSHGHLVRRLKGESSTQWQARITADIKKGAERINDEIARASGNEGTLAIAVCLLENLDEIKGAGGPGRAREVVQRTVKALRTHLRAFDVMGRTENGEFSILLPDPVGSGQSQPRTQQRILPFRQGCDRV